MNLALFNDHSETLATMSSSFNENIGFEKSGWLLLPGVMRSDLEIRPEYTWKIQNSESHVGRIDTKSLNPGYLKKLLTTPFK